jgi:hypothetical protein
MAVFGQMPLPIVNYTFACAPRRSDSSSSWSASSLSLAKPTSRNLGGRRRLADTNSSQTILHGRPSTAQREDLPPYSLDRDLPVYTASDGVHGRPRTAQDLPSYSLVRDLPGYTASDREESQSDSTGPKYLSIFLICKLEFFAFDEGELREGTRP